MITHVFSFSSVSCPREALEVHEALDLGRFDVHSRARPDRYLSVVELDASRNLHLASDLDDVGQVDVNLQVWLDGSGLAQLHLSHHVAADRSSIARVLNTLCHHRDSLRLDGKPLVGWFQEETRSTTPPVLRQDVLQIVDVAPEQYQMLVAGDDISLDALGIVFRDPHGTFASRGSLRRPTELNRGSGSFGVHGRGVLLVAGHDQQTVNALRMTSAELLFALGRARRARAAVEQALRQAQVLSEDTGPPTEVDVLRALADTVRRQRMVMSLDVRAFADGLFVPEILIDDFRRSFADVLRLDEVTESSTALVDTLSEVASSFLDEATLLAARSRASRERSWRLVVGIASGIAVPIALLLSYFGVGSQVTAPPERSIFDLVYYAAPWAVTVVAAVVVVALSLRQHRLSDPE